MPSHFTKNYNLSQWERADKVLMEDFNADNAKIDAALKEADRRIETKADQSALDALSQTVNGKADAQALSTLSQTVASHAAALNKKGNCRVELKSYTGTGTFGDDNPTMISFSRKPMMVIFMGPGDGGFVIAFRDVTSAQYSNGYSVTVRWSGNSVGLWNARAPGLQLNEKGGLYYILGLIPMDE